MANRTTAGAGGPGKNHRRAVIWSLLIILAGTLIAPLGGYVYVAAVSAQTGSETQANPRANFWRAVREGDKGYTAVKGQETNVLIQNGGENWRQVRNGPLANYGGWLLAAILFGIAAFHVIFGRARLAEPRSGNRVLRWTAFDRTLHWFVAILFILLAITGLSILYGRAVVMPVMGKEGFAAYAEFAKNVHNYLGPFFVAGLAVMLLVWIKEHAFTKVDWEWVKQGGGYFGKAHPHAGKVNGGEKVWFWLLFVLGIVLSASGLVLNFPNFGFDRETMQISNILHIISGVFLVGVSLGHIYIGTLGNEASFEGMLTGYVDEVWAKQHHDLWLEDVKKGTAGPAQPDRTGVGQTRPA
jgi:formate dehydrogenase subunit gamma